MNLQNTGNFFESMDVMRQEIGILFQSQQIYGAILASLIANSENQEIIIQTENIREFTGKQPVVSQVGTALRVYLPEEETQEQADGDS